MAVLLALTVFWLAYYFLLGLVIWLCFVRVLTWVTCCLLNLWFALFSALILICSLVIVITFDILFGSDGVLLAGVSLVLYYVVLFRIYLVLLT